MNARPSTHAPPPKDTLAGTVERVTFHNADSGFCVLKLQMRGKRDLITLIGHAPAIGAGEWVTATGLWLTDRQHGLQFKAETLKVTPPTGVEGIEKYLASGYMRGIGPAMAKRIVAAFGEGTFEIIEAEPDRLKEVVGIGPTRARSDQGRVNPLRFQTDPLPLRASCPARREAPCIGGSPPDTVLAIRGEGSMPRVA